MGKQGQFEAYPAPADGSKRGRRASSRRRMRRPIRHHLPPAHAATGGVLAPVQRSSPDTPMYESPPTFDPAHGPQQQSSPSYPPQPTPQQLQARHRRRSSLARFYMPYGNEFEGQTISLGMLEEPPHQHPPQFMHPRLLHTLCAPPHPHAMGNGHHVQMLPHPHPHPQHQPQMVAGGWSTAPPGDPSGDVWSEYKYYG
ncbi:uncharacterized protein BXZ73DRAFT_102215 [Epithele typhae]|uniref:uncharacterized protein n=1 Tax=Epithele typhae TaxID=378194 RepID=UPI00200886EF|nr:uncharacterized protein BXZ73DRAFT_102215 [Epithele typhae]KAH9929061.1 hypothetical protein BXZ73DRAFT_102215 [Epithele typhae]